MAAEAVAMTKASAARITRRRGSRPRRDYSDDPDLVIAETAFALEVAWGLSERTAIDWALVIHQAEPAAATKIPRGGKAGALLGAALPHQASFHGRNRDIRRKLEIGKLQPDAQRVRAIARLLHHIRTCRLQVWPTRHD
jgi:hypothetical protein